MLLKIVENNVFKNIYLKKKERKNKVRTREGRFSKFYNIFGSYEEWDFVFMVENC